MSENAIDIINLKKQYRLGAIGGQTLRGDIQSWWARKRGKEDPNSLIGQGFSNSGGKFNALDGINLHIKRGEAVGIIGGNGAGKSTLLKILSRVTSPSEGEVWINGRVASMLEVGTGFHGELTGRENIYMNGAILGMTKREVDSKIESIIDFSECRQFIDTPVKRYSSGMYVKLAFAVASHLDAEIMIMDEVLAVGDVAFQKKCLSKMGDEAQGGKTVLYVSHNMTTVRNLCNRCVVLEKGKVIFDGNTEDAINMYLGTYEKHLPCLYDFTKIKKTEPEKGTIIYLEEFEFINKEIASFDSLETIKIRIKWKAKEKVDNVHIMLSIYRADNTPIGMAYSKEIIQSEKEFENDTFFSLEDLKLSEGIYYCYVEAAYLEYTSTGLDNPQVKIYFQINQSASSFRWLSNSWGNIQFYNNLKLISTNKLN